MDSPDSPIPVTDPQEPSFTDTLLGAMEKHGDMDGTEAQLNAATNFLSLALSLMTPEQVEMFRVNAEINEYLEDYE